MAVFGKSKIEELEVLGNANIEGELSASNIEQTLTNNEKNIPSSKAVYENTLKTASADAESISATSPAEVTVTNEDRNSHFHFKIPSGQDGKLLLLQPNSYFFQGDPDGVVREEQTITLSVLASNIVGPVTWDDSTIPAGTMQHQITASVGATYEKSFTITADGLSSTVTIGTLKSGDSPFQLCLTNDTYTFTVKGGETPEIVDVLPQAVSGIRILRGNYEQEFTIGTAASGWGVSAVFTAIADDTASVDASLFNGEILEDGTVRVTTISPNLSYGEILITATNAEAGITLSSEVSVRVQKSAGFGTPQVETETLAPGNPALVTITADPDSPEESKIFHFEFKIPRGDDPLFMTLNPDCVPIPASITGYVDPDINVIGASSVRVYEGPEDVTVSQGWTFTALGSDAVSVVYNIDSTGAINVLGWGGTENSYVKTIQATRPSDNVTISKGILFYKARAGAGQEGPAGPAAGFGDVTASVMNDSGESRVVVETNGPDTAKNIDFTFYNVGGGKLYDTVNSKTDGGVTPNAVYEFGKQFTLSKRVERHTFVNSISSYTVPSYKNYEALEVFYNGARLTEGLNYTFNPDTGVITFSSTLGGNGITQNLVVVLWSIAVPLEPLPTPSVSTYIVDAPDGSTSICFFILENIGTYADDVSFVTTTPSGGKTEMGTVAEIKAKTSLVYSMMEPYLGVTLPDNICAYHGYTTTTDESQHYTLKATQDGAGDSEGIDISQMINDMISGPQGLPVPQFEISSIAYSNLNTNTSGTVSVNLANKESYPLGTYISITTKNSTQQISGNTFGASMSEIQFTGTVFSFSMVINTLSQISDTLEFNIELSATGYKSSTASDVLSFRPTQVQAPSLSLSRSGTSVNGTISNTQGGCSYYYKTGSVPTGPSDGTAISGTTFSFTSMEAISVYVWGVEPSGASYMSNVVSGSADPADLGKLPTPTLTVNRGTGSVTAMETIYGEIGNTVEGAEYYWGRGTVASPTGNTKIIGNSFTISNNTSSESIRVRGFYEPYYEESDIAIDAVSPPSVPDSFSVSLSRNGDTVNGTIVNGMSGITYRYTVNTMSPQDENDGTAISGTSFSFVNAGEVTVYVRGFRTGWSMSNAQSASIGISETSIPVPSLSFSNMKLTITNYSSYPSGTTWTFGSIGDEASFTPDSDGSIFVTNNTYGSMEFTITASYNGAQKSATINVPYENYQGQASVGNPSVSTSGTTLSVSCTSSEASYLDRAYAQGQIVGNSSVVVASGYININGTTSVYVPTAQNYSSFSIQFLEAPLFFSGRSIIVEPSGAVDYSSNRTLGLTAS